MYVHGVSDIEFTVKMNIILLDPAIHHWIYTYHYASRVLRPSVFQTLVSYPINLRPALLYPAISSLDI